MPACGPYRDQILQSGSGKHYPQYSKTIIRDDAMLRAPKDVQCAESSTLLNKPSKYLYNLIKMGYLHN